MRKRLAVILVSALALSSMATAQSGSSPQDSPATTGTTPQTSAEPSTQATGDAAQQNAKETPEQKKARKEQEKKEKKEKKEKEKKEKQSKKDSNDTLNTSQVFSERVADDVLGKIRDGLEGHSQRLMLSAFDDDKMDGYLSFEDQIEAFFNRYEGFRVQFRILNVTIEGPKGIVNVDVEMEELPRAGGAPQRKHSSLRFELESGKKGWRVVDVHDRGFFS